MSTSLRSISNQHNQKQQCERSFWSWFSLVQLDVLRLDALQTILLKSGMNLKSLSVKRFNLITEFLVAHVGPVAVALKSLISTRAVNARLLVGMALVGIITPLADVFYTWLPQGRVPESKWYYESWYWLFLCLGPYISMVAYFIGTFLLPRVRFSKYILIYPLLFPVTKIAWLIQASNHDEYLAVPSFTYYIYTAVSLLVIALITDYLAWRKYHGADSFPKRMDGLCQVANMSDPIQAGFVKTWNEMKAKNY